MKRSVVASFCVAPFQSSWWLIASSLRSLSSPLAGGVTQCQRLHFHASASYDKLRRIQTGDRQNPHTRDTQQRKALQGATPSPPCLERARPGTRLLVFVPLGVCVSPACTLLSIDARILVRLRVRLRARANTSARSYFSQTEEPGSCGFMCCARLHKCSAGRHTTCVRFWRVVCAHARA